LRGLGNEPVSGPDSSSLAPLRVERLAPLRVERDFGWELIAGLGLLLPQLRGILPVRVERDPRRMLHGPPRRRLPFRAYDRVRHPGQVELVDAIKWGRLSKV
jgi:hypothetical protein